MKSLLTMQFPLVFLAIVCLVSGAKEWLPRGNRGKPPPSGLTEIFQLRYSLLEMEEDLWEKIQDPRWKEVKNGNEHGPDVEIAKIFGSFCDRIEEMFPYNKLSENVQEESWVWSRIASERYGVDKLFETFRRFLREQQRAGWRGGAGPQAWENLAETILEDPTNSVSKALEKISHLLEHSNFYAHALEESSSRLCTLQQSPQQLLYNMYNTITLTEIKGYSMMQFSWMLLRLYGKGNFTVESNLMRERFEQRTSSTAIAVKSALLQASREIWRCDPAYHEEGDTFVALTRLLQGFIENEVDMNKDNTCRENCAYYNYAKNHGCFKEQYCSRQPPCTGKILNCQYIDSDMWICPATRNSGRRYEWIEYENGRVLGQKGSCLRGSTKVDSWWRWLFWHCSYCMCFCDQPGVSSDRYFSLWESVSDFANNKIITGVRFTKENRVIHLQISEATLVPGGKVDPATVRWKAVPTLDIKSASVTNGQDYFTMSNEERSIDLDDLEGLPGHLLTGVRFRKVGSHLNFEIQVTPFNFTTGKLIAPKFKSVWMSNDNTDAASHKPRTEVYLNKPDIPTRSKSPSLPDSKSDQFIQFTHSDLDADAGQTTVPFLDAQPVTSLFPMPLSGAGLYHKGAEFYGGFVAPKVFTYDYSKHMELVFPLVDDVVN